MPDMPPPSNPLKDKILFAISHPVNPKEADTVILGITKDAWLYMKDGMTHTFDLTKVGLNIKLILYGAEDQKAAMAEIEKFLVKQETEINIDMRDKKDFFKID